MTKASYVSRREKYGSQIIEQTWVERGQEAEPAVRGRGQWNGKVEAVIRESIDLCEWKGRSLWNRLLDSSRSLSYSWVEFFFPLMLNVSVGLYAPVFLGCSCIDVCCNKSYLSWETKIR